MTPRPLTPRALRTRWAVQRLARLGAAATPDAAAASCFGTPRGVAPARPALEAMGLSFASPLLLAAGFDRRGCLLADAAALGIGGIERGSFGAALAGCRPLFPPAASRRDEAGGGRVAPPPRRGLSLLVPPYGEANGAEALGRALAAWHAGTDYVVLNPARAPVGPPELVELLAGLGALRERLVRPRRLALVAKLPAAWMEGDDRLAWAHRLVEAGADGLLVCAEGAAERACARLAELSAALGPRVCLISVGGIDSPRVARARLQAGARLLQMHRALLAAPAVVAGLLAGIGALPRTRGD